MTDHSAKRRRGRPPRENKTQSPTERLMENPCGLEDLSRMRGNVVLEIRKQKRRNTGEEVT